MQARERFSRPPARYAEASLVKQLEEQGIGRPSTYAPTIATIQQRGYVVKESREGHERSYQLLTLRDKDIQKTVGKETTGSENNKLFPTDMAMVVNDFLVQHFSEITDYGFTAKVEDQLDEIAIGHKAWNQMLAEFYDQFYPKVQTIQGLERKIINPNRLLGQDPVSDKPVIARMGKYGPLVQIGNTGEEPAPRFAGLQKDQRLESITLDEALDLFKLPRTVGQWESNPIVVNAGRFGPYLKYQDKNYTLPVGENPLTVTIEQAIAIIEEKQQSDAAKIIKTFSEDLTVQILNGHWGPYIKAGKSNIKIPKGVDPQELDWPTCYDLIQKSLPVTPSKSK
jgi:DNA topoisomerase-1